MLHRLLLVVGITFSIGLSAYGQTPARGQLTGRIIDAVTQQPMPFATVAVWKKTGTDSTLAGGAQTDDQGRFSVPNLPFERLWAVASFVGYVANGQAVALTTGQPTSDLGTLSLRSDSRLLNEVKVTGEKAAISLSTEKQVFNVAKNITTVGGTAEALLRNVPSIIVDESGNATLRNLATTIYINGKPTQLTLAQIPANQIESVEVITNPSARYDASTSGGIVNLVLKKNRQPGYNGLISLGIGNNHRYDATANVDWRQGRWNVTGLYSLNATQNPLTGYTNRVNRNAATGQSTGFFDQNTAIQLNNTFQNGRIAADYTASPRDVLTVAGTVAAGAFNNASDQQYTYRDAAGNRTGYGGRTVDPHNNFTNVGAEFDWKHSYARKGQELSLTTSINRNQVSNAAEWYTTSFNSDGTSQPNFPERDRINGRTAGTQYLAQLDYVRPLGDSARWEFGARSFTFSRDLQYFFNQQLEVTQAYQLVIPFSQNAAITETVNAVYGMYTKQLRNGIGIQAGLRLEQSSLTGQNRFDNSSFGYNYPSKTGQNWFQAFFPTFSATKKLSELSELGLSLSRKVGRPGFRQVSASIQASDRQNITIGNPALRPEFVNTAELIYNRTIGSAQWLATAYYIYEDHTIKPFVQPSLTDSSLLVTTFVNVKADIQYGLDQTLKMDLGRHLSLLGSLNVRHFAIQSATTQNQLWVYNAKINLTYRFPANITAQLTGTRDSRSVQLQGYRLPVNAADFALRKGIWQNRGSLVFTVNDIFNSRRFLTTYEQPTVFQQSMNRREVRFYKVTVQIPLGGADASKRKERNDRPDVDFSN
ncbi:outer membrane beta-barrel protein [Fibrella forsythiae]|uniref:TonB-dependent receptor n=1 Tax=Fibrella forsythiae TaxID=2817061 RepID=A0ABS3JR01_9BACT|nr:outer membrane beta-barrel protein [Fibrella forsythiae]MBO0951614.1 TonB-dependent receptor [Fibrella forsythiae]